MNFKSIKKWFHQNLSTLLIIVGAFVGFALGFAIRAYWPSIPPTVVTYIGLPGKLLVRAFSMILVPLVICSLSTSIASTKRGKNKRMVAMTFAIFILLSTLCTIFSISLLYFSGIGIKDDEQSNHKSFSVHSKNSLLLNTKTQISKEDALIDVLTNSIPSNIIAATFMQEYTALKPINAANLSMGYEKVVQNSFKPNMLGLCVFALILGFALASMGNNQVDHFKQLLEEINKTVMKIMMSLIYIMPIGMLSWMCQEAIKMESAASQITQIISFFLIASLCLSLYFFIFLPLLYFLVVHKNPFKYYFNLIPVVIFAFGTSSSAMSLPINLKCAEESNLLSTRVTRFVLPLGMAFHKNGVSLYYPMVALFIGRMHNMEIGIQQLVALTLASVLFSMAFPGAPGQGGGTLVNMLAVCAVLGISNPFDVLPFIMAGDWFFERLRTVASVIGDAFVAAIVEKYCIESYISNELQV